MTHIPEEKIDEMREWLRTVMVAQPRTEENEAYSDGFANGLGLAIQKIDQLCSPELKEHRAQGGVREDFTDYAYAAEDGWKEWNGGGCPVPLRVKVDYRDRGRKNGYFTAQAGALNWSHHGHSGDIVAYRLSALEPAAVEPVAHMLEVIDVLLDNCHVVEDIDIAAQHEEVKKLVRMIAAHPAAVEPGRDERLAHDIGVWKMVPLRPTEEMVDAADRVRPLPEFYLTEAWAAMIAAAPETPFKQPLSHPSPSPMPVVEWEPTSFLPNPMSTAPKDGTMLRLLVRFDGDSSVGAFEDADTGWTIGANNLANTGDDQWDVVGWDWEQDTFRQAHTAEPIGWLPFLTAALGQSKESK